jgi:hypothetical protein
MMPRPVQLITLVVAIIATSAFVLTWHQYVASTKAPVRSPRVGEISAVYEPRWNPGEERDMSQLVIDANRDAMIRIDLGEGKIATFWGWLREEQGLTYLRPYVMSRSAISFAKQYDFESNDGFWLEISDSDARVWSDSYKSETWLRVEGLPHD